MKNTFQGDKPKAIKKEPKYIYLQQAYTNRSYKLVVSLTI